MTNPKTQVDTVLDFNGARCVVIRNQHGYVLVQWEEAASNDKAQYRAHRIECDRRWRVVGVA